MKAIIITGGSKGLGKSLVTLYNTEGYKVYSLARTINSELKDVNQISVDLSNVSDSQLVLNKVMDEILNQNPSSITLINNAGTLGKMDTLQEIPSENIETTVSLNYTTPMIFCSIFSKKLENYKGVKKIRNISSGAANGAYHGWSVYCSTKSAMDSFTKVLAIEQENNLSPIHVLSIYPGVIDTEMQAEIRKSTQEQFSNVERFIEMKKNNDLSTPEQIANLVYKIDHDVSIKNGEITDVRDFY